MVADEDVETLTGPELHAVLDQFDSLTAEDVTTPQEEEQGEIWGLVFLIHQECYTISATSSTMESFSATDHLGTPGVVEADENEKVTFTKPQHVTPPSEAPPPEPKTKSKSTKNLFSVSLIDFVAFITVTALQPVGVHVHKYMLLCFSQSEDIVMLEFGKYT